MASPTGEVASACTPLLPEGEGVARPLTPHPWASSSPAVGMGAAAPPSDAFAAEFAAARQESAQLGSASPRAGGSSGAVQQGAGTAHPTVPVGDPIAMCLLTCLLPFLLWGLVAAVMGDTEPESLDPALLLLLPLALCACCLLAALRVTMAVSGDETLPFTSHRNVCGACCLPLCLWAAVVASSLAAVGLVLFPAQHGVGVTEHVGTKIAAIAACAVFVTVPALFLRPVITALVLGGSGKRKDTPSSAPESAPFAQWWEAAATQRLLHSPGACQLPAALLALPFALAVEGAAALPPLTAVLCMVDSAAGQVVLRPALHGTHSFCFDGNAGWALLALALHSFLALAVLKWDSGLSQTTLEGTACPLSLQQESGEELIVQQQRATLCMPLGRGWGARSALAQLLHTAVLLRWAVALAMPYVVFSGALVTVFWLLDLSHLRSNLDLLQALWPLVLMLPSTVASARESYLFLQHHSEQGGKAARSLQPSLQQGGGVPGLPKKLREAEAESTAAAEAALQWAAQSLPDSHRSASALRAPLWRFGHATHSANRHGGSLLPSVPMDLRELKATLEGQLSTEGQSKALAVTTAWVALSQNELPPSAVAALARGQLPTLDFLLAEQLQNSIDDQDRGGEGLPVMEPRCCPLPANSCCLLLLSLLTALSVFFGPIFALHGGGVDPLLPDSAKPGSGGFYGVWVPQDGGEAMAQVAWWLSFLFALPFLATAIAWVLVYRTEAENLAAQARVLLAPEAVQRVLLAGQRQYGPPGLVVGVNHVLARAAQARDDMQAWLDSNAGRVLLGNLVAALGYALAAVFVVIVHHRGGRGVAYSTWLSVPSTWQAVVTLLTLTAFAMHILLQVLAVDAAITKALEGLERVLLDHAEGGFKLALSSQLANRPQVPAAAGSGSGAEGVVSAKLGDTAGAAEEGKATPTSVRRRSSIDVPSATCSVSATEDGEGTAGQQTIAALVGRQAHLQAARVEVRLWRGQYHGMGIPLCRERRGTYGCPRPTRVPVSYGLVVSQVVSLVAVAATAVFHHYAQV